jgi:hypothetical protein
LAYPDSLPWEQIKDPRLKIKDQLNNSQISIHNSQMI